MSLNALDNLANLIFLGAYWVKDILWLRLLVMVGSLVVIPYYLLRAEPLWTPTMWSCVFISIHAVRAWGIVKERRPVAFTGDEQLLYDKTKRRARLNLIRHLLDSIPYKNISIDLPKIPKAQSRPKGATEGVSAGHPIPSRY
jgi:hypothetical protein